MGLHPAWFWAAIAAGVEFVCGPLLVLGLLTPQIGLASRHH